MKLPRPALRHASRQAVFGAALVLSGVPLLAIAQTPAQTSAQTFAQTAAQTTAQASAQASPQALPRPDAPFAAASPSESSGVYAEREIARAMQGMAQLARLDPPPGDTRAFIADELASERPVKGAPYCADAVHETVQYLPDPSGAAANRIVRRQQTRLCRDGEGRTRQEIERDGRRRVYLHDPVSRESWVLDPQQRSARKLGSSSSVGWSHAAIQSESDSAAWRDYGERMREWARSLAERVKAQTSHGAQAGAGSATATPGSPAVPPTPPAPPTPPTPPTPVVVMADAAGEGGRDMQVRVLRSENAGMAGAELPLPPGMALRAGSLAPRGPGVLTALGSKDIEGLRAGGERTTWTIDAGRQGNEKPIVISREIWRSPDLLVTVQSSDFDPRSGETRYRLTNIKRGEPEAALMQVPADYQRRGPGTSAPGNAPSAPAPASRARG